MDGDVTDTARGHIRGTGAAFLELRPPDCDRFRR